MQAIEVVIAASASCLVGWSDARAYFVEQDEIAPMMSVIKRSRDIVRIATVPTPASRLPFMKHPLC